ncbi:MAG TPA: (d)CMP kinase [Bacteroidia bacterium]|nr:(d)CMP kinase [Bacteroidia bacterium]
MPATLSLLIVSAEHPVIAIDGYSSCGKSTVARAVARELGLRYIDSGAMYRAVTLYFLQNNIPLDKSDYSAELDAIHIRFKVHPDTGYSDVFLNGKDVSNAIRSMEVSDQVSHVSTLKAVRTKMVQLQQQMKGEGGLVMDGRDIGTTVFPDADVKIFMTADPEIRAVRRFHELNANGTSISLEEVRNNINSRDFEDTHRTESPLRQAADAVVLDNSHLNYDEQLAFVLNKVSLLK